MRTRAVFAVLAAGIGLQALLGAGALFDRARDSLAAGYSHRLLDDTEARLQAALGAEFPIVAALRRVASQGEWVLVEGTPAALPAGGMQQAYDRLGRLRLLQNALFPTPILVLLPQPIANAERALQPGKDVLLLVLAGDPAPDGRAGWTCLERAPEFQLWRLQKG